MGARFVGFGFWIVLSVLAAMPGLAKEPADDQPAGKRPAGNQPDDGNRIADRGYPLAFQKRVNAAIQDGVRWLKGRQLPSGRWRSRHSGAEMPDGHFAGYPMGVTALATLTLLKGGIKPDDPAVVRAFDYLRKLPMRRTYSVGVLLMAIDAKYAAARDPFAVETKDRYGSKKKKDQCAENISSADKKWMRKAVAFLLEKQTSRGSWRYPTNDDFDLSNMQYALLGLQAANRCAVKVPKRVFLDALKFILEHQEKVGRPVLYKANEVRGRYRFEWTEPSAARGFRYHSAKHPISGSMTTAGLAGLIICQSALWRSRTFSGKLRKQSRAGIRDAMAWMQVHFAVDRNPIETKDKQAPPVRPGLDRWHYYYLYGMERAGELGRIRFFGDIDWYLQGAEFLLERQDRDWLTPSSLENSCFAILFLKRATTRVHEPVITPRAKEAAPAK